MLTFVSLRFLKEPHNKPLRHLGSGLVQRWTLTLLWSLNFFLLGNFVFLLEYLWFTLLSIVLSLDRVFKKFGCSELNWTNCLTYTLSKANSIWSLRLSKVCLPFTNCCEWSISMLASHQDYHWSFAQYKMKSSAMLMKISWFKRSELLHSKGIQRKFFGYCLAKCRLKPDFLFTNWVNLVLCELKDRILYCGEKSWFLFYMI